MKRNFWQKEQKSKEWDYTENTVLGFLTISQKASPLSTTKLRPHKASP